MTTHKLKRTVKPTKRIWRLEFPSREFGWFYSREAAESFNRGKTGQVFEYRLFTTKKHRKKKLY